MGGFPSSGPSKSLRDEFAEIALGALIAKQISRAQVNATQVAEDAYRYADAMLAERSKK